MLLQSRLALFLIVVGICCGGISEASFSAYRNGSTAIGENNHHSVIGVPIGPGPCNYWPDALVPYVIDFSMDSTDIANFEEAISDYHRKTCIRWVRRDSEDAYVRVKRLRNSDGCAWADNCHTGGERVAVFAHCNGRDTFIHELGHTLCFGHEQARNDKEGYVEDCDKGKYEHINLGHLYDYRSIMHYGCHDCLKPKLEGVSKDQCGSPKGLSVLDAEKLNDAYKCEDCFSYRFRFPFMIDSNSRPFPAGTQPNNEGLYICRAYMHGDIVPGKAVARRNGDWTCWVSWGGSEMRIDDKEQFEVFTNPKAVNFRWIRANKRDVPPNAIPGGRTANAETLYIGRCRAQIGREYNIIPGKVHENKPDGMFYGYGGEEHWCDNFDFLVCY